LLVAGPGDGDDMVEPPVDLRVSLVDRPCKGDVFHVDPWCGVRGENLRSLRHSAVETGERAERVIMHDVRVVRVTLPGDLDPRLILELAVECLCNRRAPYESEEEHVFHEEIDLHGQLLAHSMAWRMHPSMFRYSN